MVLLPRFILGSENFAAVSLSMEIKQETNIISLTIPQAGYEMRGVDLDLLDEVFLGLDGVLINYLDGNKLNLDYNNVELNLDIVDLLLGLNGHGVYVFANQLGVGKGIITTTQLLDKLLLVSSLLEEHGLEFVVKRFYLAISERECLEYEPFNSNLRTIADNTECSLPNSYLMSYHEDNINEEFKPISRIFIGSEYNSSCSDEYLFAKNCEINFIPLELAYLLSNC